MDRRATMRPGDLYLEALMKDSNLSKERDCTDEMAACVESAFDQRGGRLADMVDIQVNDICSFSIPWYKSS